MTDETRLPDLYADEVGLTVYGHGVVLTLQRIDPGKGAGATEGHVVEIARIRIPTSTAHALVEVLGKQLAIQQAALANLGAAAEQESTKKH